MTIFQLAYQEELLVFKIKILYIFDGFVQRLSRF